MEAGAPTHEPHRDQVLAASVPDAAAAGCSEGAAADWGQASGSWAASQHGPLE